MVTVHGITHHIPHMNINEYDLNPINYGSIDVARSQFALTDLIMLTFEPGDTTRYRIVLMANSIHDGSTLTIERHPSYGSLKAQSTTVIGAPACDADRITAADMEPISNNNVHTSFMLAALINNFLER